jgi:hypothetical protein
MFKWLDSLFAPPEYAPAVFPFRAISQRSASLKKISEVRAFYNRRPRPWRWYGAI